MRGRKKYYIKTLNTNTAVKKTKTYKTFHDRAGYPGHQQYIRCLIFTLTL